MNKPALSLTVVLLLAMSAPLVGLRAQPAPVALDAVAEPAHPDWARLPLALEPNAGQSDPEARFLAHTPAGLLFFTPDEVVLALKAPVPSSAAAASKRPADPAEVETPAAGPTLRLAFIDANPAARLVGDESLPGRVSYFIGSDPSQWRTDLPTYARVTYAQLYPGIDLAYRGGGGQLKGTYTLAPGADPAQIRWRYEGARAVTLDANGDLQIELSAPDGTSTWRVSEPAPVAWQETEGQRVPVSARYVVNADGSIGFALGAYDRTRALVIDPTLVYSTYLGGAGSDWGHGIAVDSSGSAYVTGMTQSTNFPLQDPFQGTHGGGFQDAFVTKFNPSGTALVYSTYLGGSDNELAHGIVVDAAGRAYVAGSTESTNFPVLDPYQGAYGGGEGDAFVTKLSPSGTALAHSTYLGGSSTDYADAIAVDAAGSAYVAGTTDSTNFPLQDPIQGSSGGLQDGFMTKFSASGATLVYSTYLGGSNYDMAYGLAIDAAGSAYIAGGTFSTDFPLHNPFQGTRRGYQDVFVTKVSASGTALVYSTYLGGSGGEEANDIAVDTAGSAYLLGDTNSTDFPRQNPFQGTFGGSADAFVTKFSPNGSALAYSTYLGGSGGEQAYGIAVDALGSAYLTGYTLSTDFPLQDPFQGTYSANEDAFVTKLSPSGTALAYSTYLGGSGSDRATDIALDAAGGAYVTGRTESANFPVQDPFQGTSGGSYDVFVTKVGPHYYYRVTLPVVLYNH